MSSSLRGCSCDRSVVSSSTSETRETWPRGSSVPRLDKIESLKLLLRFVGLYGASVDISVPVGNYDSNSKGTRLSTMDSRPSGPSMITYYEFDNVNVAFGSKACCFSLPEAVALVLLSTWDDSFDIWLMNLYLAFFNGTLHLRCLTIKFFSLLAPSEAFETVACACLVFTG